MSDRPKPGKDKDLRCIRQAIDETDKLYSLFVGEINAHKLPDNASLIAEAMLLTIDQLDFLDQMLSDTTLSPIQAVEHNRYLRNILRLMMQQRSTSGDLSALLCMIQAVGDQLKSLLVVKEIRAND